MSEDDAQSLHLVGYYAQAVEAIGIDIPFVIQDYPLTLLVVMTPAVILASSLTIRHA